MKPEPPPDHLGDDVKTMWWATLGQLRDLGTTHLVTAADLAAYCQAVVTPAGKVAAYQVAVDEFSVLAETIRCFTSKCGLNHASRVRLSLVTWDGQKFVRTKKPKNRRPTK
ncbi:MAG: hypothetical protein ACYCXI_03460 [Dethiobacteraceae bacterium]